MENIKMGILNDLKPNKANPEDQTRALMIKQADNGYKDAEKETLNALQSFGRTVYEAEKDNTESPFSEDIKQIKDCMEKEYLWKLYRLGLDGETECENCGARIPSDSIYCNKCAAKIPERDFSTIGYVAKPKSQLIEQNACPQCGSPLPEGAVFCEKCGTKILSSSKVVAPISDNQTDNNTCPQCGATLTDGAVFCEKCGIKLV